MYQLLAWQTLKKVFGLSSKWSEGENGTIEKLKQEAEKHLTSEQSDFVNRRTRQLKVEISLTDKTFVKPKNWREL